MNPATFSCTSCGRCCHDLRLSLSMDEAQAWLLRDGLVQILCYAAPSIDRAGAPSYQEQRSFSASSGSLDIKVHVLLVASFEGPCPNLRSDMLCGIYESRPQTCRIYPAEIIPGRKVEPAQKLCPPVAWESQAPFLSTDGEVVDHDTRRAIDTLRNKSLREADGRRRLVDHLGIDAAALENEGYAVWTFEREVLTQALSVALAHPDADRSASRQAWRFLSLRPRTIAMIREAGAELAPAGERSELDYLPLY